MEYKPLSRIVKVKLILLAWLVGQSVFLIPLTIAQLIWPQPGFWPGFWIPVVMWSVLPWSPAFFLPLFVWNDWSEKEERHRKKVQIKPPQP